ncbi:MAG: WbqC family protein [Saprospiraceae bacterium]|nr:WbqC family protein [Saprospiraceae bacterium]
MKPLLIELHTFPSIAYFHAMVHHNLLILEASENYNKRSYRNKFDLLSDKGVQTFSIPLKKGKHEQQPILETKISYDENWPDLLKRTLTTYYSGSPFFDHYSSALFNLLDAHIEDLYEFNFLALMELMQMVSINISIASNIDFHRASTHVNDLRYTLLPKSRIEHKSYPQVFEDKTGFICNLSILDLLFALGPETKEFLMSTHLYCKNISA